MKKKIFERRNYGCVFRAKDDPKGEITGHAAVFNVLSVDLGGWKERIIPGAFARALREEHDVYSLFNHDVNMVLGRTESKTLSLKEDKEGLSFVCKLPDTQYARDISAIVERKDIDQCSFGFVPIVTKWSEEPDPDDEKESMIVRELHDVDLFDVSVVTFPAYPQTDAGVRRVSIYGDERFRIIADAPPAIRAKLKQRAADDNEAKCECECEQCKDGDCANCSNDDCNDANCKNEKHERARAETTFAMQRRTRLAKAEKVCYRAVTE